MTLDLIRRSMSSQNNNKALHCYLLMTVWILLLVAGVYKFLEPKRKLGSETPTILSIDNGAGGGGGELFHRLTYDVKTRRIFKICNFPDEISPGDEGIPQVLVSDDNNNGNRWELKGILLLIRHGDRGPLQHVRNITAVNCGSDDNDLSSAYKSYLHNVTIMGKATWAGPGPFHGFPLLPIHLTQCQLGQLTMQGINQLLQLGRMLRNNNYLAQRKRFSQLRASEILVYSTRYRRTFQSALALLYGFLANPDNNNNDTLTKLTINESQSMNFCFKDCACPIIEKLWKSVKKSIGHQLRSHPAVALLASTTGKSLFSPGADQSVLGGDPHSVRDALLTYVCHRGSGLPCDTPTNCIKRQNVAGVFAYTDWVNYQKWHNTSWKRLCLLRSYGLIRHIVRQMLRMVADNGPYFVLYSGHDHTVEQLTTAFGLHNDPLLLRYAARIVFEVYQKTANDDDDDVNDNADDNNNDNNVKGVYFRLLSNGKDVTRQIGFCKNLIYLDDSKISLCKIEDIVRFIHDDYFASLNVTNFKDACMFSRND